MKGRHNTKIIQIHQIEHASMYILYWIQEQLYIYAVCGAFFIKIQLEASYILHLCKHLCLLTEKSQSQRK